MLHRVWLQQKDFLQFDCLVGSENPVNLPVLLNDYGVQVMMGGELVGSEQVHRLQFVFFSRVINRVVALSVLKHGEAEKEANLEDFAAVVLKNVWNSVLHRKLLVFTDRGKKLLQPLHVRVRLHRCGTSRSSLAATRRAAAIFPILSIETFRSPRSIEPMYVRCNPARCASSSWEIPRWARSLRMFCA